MRLPFRCRIVAIMVVFCCNYLWKYNVNAQQNQDSLSFVLTGNTLEDLSTQLEAEANKAFKVLEENPEDLPTVVSSLAAQVVSATTQLMLQFIKSTDPTKDPADLAAQAVGSALSQATQSSTGDFAALDVQGIQDEIRNTVEQVVTTLDKNSSIEQIVESVGQQVLDVVGQAFAKVTGGTFSGTFALSNSTPAPNGGSKALNTSAPLDIVQITNDLKDSMSETLAQVDQDADIDTLQGFLSNELFNAMTQPMLQLVYSSIQQGQLSTLASQISLTVQNALSSLKNSLDDTPFDGLDIDQVGRDVEQAVQEAVQGNNSGITEIDLTKQVAEKAMNAIINGFNTAVISNTGSLILKTGDIAKLSRDLQIVVSTVLQSISEETNMTEVRNSVVTDLFDAMSQIVTSIVYTLFQESSSSSDTPQQIASIFQTALSESVKDTIFQDLEVDKVGPAVEQAVIKSLNGPIREMPELTTDAASAAMNAAINQLLITLGPSTVSIDSAIDPVELTNKLIESIRSFIPSLTANPDQNKKSTFQINILREIATSVSALTYSMLDFGEADSTQQINQILDLLRAALEEIQKAPGGYQNLDINSTIVQLESKIQDSFSGSVVNGDLIAQQVAQQVVDVIAEELATVSKVLVTLAVSVSAQINNALQSPQTGKEAIISVLQGGNSVAIADAIVDSLGTSSEAAVSEALVLVLQENVSLPDQVVAALATSLSIAQTTDPDSADVLIEVFISASQGGGGPDTLILPRLVTQAFTDSEEEVKDAFVQILSQLGNRSEDGCGLLTDLLVEVTALAKTQDDIDAITQVITDSPKLSKCLVTPPPPPLPIQFQDLLESPQGAAKFVSENIDQMSLVADVIVNAFNNGQQEQVINVLNQIIVNEELGNEEIAILFQTLLEVSNPQMLSLLTNVIKQVAESANGVDVLVKLFGYGLDAAENTQQSFLQIAASVDSNCTILKPVFLQLIASATSPSQQNSIITALQSEPALQDCVEDEESPVSYFSGGGVGVSSPPAPWFVGVISVEFQESINNNPQSAANVIADNIVYPTATALAIVDALEEPGSQDNLVVALSLALNDEKISSSEFGVVMEVVLQAGGPTALSLMSDVFSVADAGVLSLLIQYAFTEAPTVQNSVTQVLVDLSSMGSNCVDVNKIISNSLATAVPEEREAILNGLQAVPQLASCLEKEEISPTPQYTVRITMEMEQVIGQPEDAKKFIVSNIQYPNEVAEALVSAINGGRYLDVSAALVLVLQEDTLQAEQLATLFQVMLALDSQQTLTLLSEITNSVGQSTERESLATLLSYAILDAPQNIQQTFVQILSNLAVDQNCAAIQATYEQLQGERQSQFVAAIQAIEQLALCSQSLLLTSAQEEGGLVSRLQFPEQGAQFIVSNLNDTESIALGIVDAIEQEKTNQLSVVLELLFADATLPVQKIAELFNFVVVLGDQETITFLAQFLDSAANTDSQLLTILLQYVFGGAPRDVRENFAKILVQIPDCGSVTNTVSNAIQTSSSPSREALLNTFLETEGLSSCVDSNLIIQPTNFDFERNNQELVSRFQTSLGDPFAAKNLLVENFGDSNAVAQAIIAGLQLGPEAEQNVVKIIVLILTDSNISVNQLAEILEIVLTSSDPRTISVLVQGFNEVAQSGNTSVLQLLVALMLRSAASMSGKEGFTTLLTGILSQDQTCGPMKEVVSSAVRQSSTNEQQQIVEYIRNSEDLYFCIDGAILQQQTQQTLTYYKTKENGTVLVGGCYDLTPSNQDNADCAQQKEWGKCERKWMLSGSFCANTCDFCSTQCIDIQPDLEYTCQQQKDNGQCDADFIVTNGFCKKTCGRCCSDIAPNSDFSCEQQKQFGKCDQPWMIAGNFCDNTCGRCGTAIAAITNPPAQSPPQPVSTCEDVQPNPWFTCEEQKGFGMCDRDWMTSLNYCAQTCGRCPVDEQTECTDFFPGDTTCQQEKEWGKCDRDWMIQQNYCQKTCGRCKQ